VGVSDDGPAISDPRFSTIQVTPTEGADQLARGTLDVYVDGESVLAGNSEKAQYALGALRLYLERQELARVAETYPESEGFPLRVAISSFPIASDGAAPEPKEIIVPSLERPPMPFEDVLKASLHLFPIFLVTVFFTSGLMEEKRDRRISVLLSSPVSPLQIIVGKMAPYVTFALLSVIVIGRLLEGEPWLLIAIFIPVLLFIFSIYLMVPLIYRTFKDTTFISMFATVACTLYLLFPAMFLDVSDLSYISPLSIAVQMYRGESFSLRAYLTSAAPMLIISAVFIYIGSRLLNEEYLTRFRPIHRKLFEAVYLAMERDHPYISVTLASLALVPLVYLAQLVILTVSTNLPARLAVGALLVASVFIEEITKSVGTVMLIENRDVRSVRSVVVLSLLSAAGFLVGEKLLVLISVRAVSQSMLSNVLLNADKLWIPLVAHFVFTAIVSLLSYSLGVRRYLYALTAGSAVHVVYNLVVLGVIG
jgi:ABC-type Na+ efflux pump permease subunit